MTKAARTSHLRIFAFALTIACVALGTMATSAFAAVVPGQLDFTNPATDPAGDGYAWSNSTKTLSLTDFNQSVEDTTAILLPDGAKVVLTGENSITATITVDTATFAGISGAGSISFEGVSSSQGDPTLTITGTSSIAKPQMVGIEAVGAVTLTDAILKVENSFTDSSTGSQAECSGIIAGSFTASGGASVLVDGTKTGRDSWGIRALSGDVTVTNSSVDLRVDRGIDGGRVTVNGAYVVVDATNVGISASSGVFADGSTFEITAGVAGDPSSTFGIATETGGLSFSNCGLTVTTRGAKSEALEIRGAGELEFIDGTTATLEADMAAVGVIHTGTTPGLDPEPASPAPIIFGDGYGILEGGSIAYTTATQSGVTASIWTIAEDPDSFEIDPDTWTATGAATTVVIGAEDDSSDPIDDIVDDTTDETSATTTGSGDVKTADAPLWPCAAIAVGALVIAYFVGVRRLARP